MKPCTHFRQVFPQCNSQGAGAGQAGHVHTLPAQHRACGQSHRGWPTSEPWRLSPRTPFQRSASVGFVPQTRRGVAVRSGRRVREQEGRGKGGLKEEKTERREGRFGPRFCPVPLSGSWQLCSDNSRSERLVCSLLSPAPPQRHFHDTGRQRKWTSLTPQQHTTVCNGRQCESCRE